MVDFFDEFFTESVSVFIIELKRGILDAAAKTLQTPKPMQL